MQHKVFAAFLFLAASILHAQHGTAASGYFPLNYAGDTWTGKVTAVNDVTREITLEHKSDKKTETFVGVLQAGYKVKRRDGSAADVNPSMIRLGTRLRVYYMLESRKVSGQKEKYNEIFLFDLLPNSAR